MLAKRFMIEMKFDLPLAVVWAHHFINGKIEEAENLCKVLMVFAFLKISVEYKYKLIVVLKRKL